MSVEQRSPAVGNSSNKMGGTGEMINAPSSVQDLRRSLYVKAKAEPSWRFWGLYVHVCKMETLREAYQMAKSNDGAPGIDGVTFEAVEKSGEESFLKQIRDEPTCIGPCEYGRRRFRRTGAKSACFRFRRSVIVWSRGHSSSSWSRSSKLTFNRGRLDTGRNGQRMKQDTEWLKRLWKRR